MAPRNMQEGRGQCGRRRLLWAEKSAGAGSYCRVRRIGIGCGKAWFYWVFLHGTALAEKHVHDELSAAIRAALLEFCHVPCSGRCVIGDRCPQGADVVEVVVAQTTGVSQDAKSPFDLMSSGSSASVGSGSGSGSGGGSQISPQTMSALLDAQSQSSAGSTTGVQEPLRRAEGPVRADRRRRRRQDQQVEEFEDGARRRRHQSRAGRQRVRQARQGRRRLGQPQGTGVGAEGRQGPSRCIADSTASDADGSNSDPFSQALQGASSTSVTNSDGSVTTSLTYADGSKVTMTSAAGKSSSTSAASSYNFIEQMIQRQAQAISSAATASLSVSV